MRTSLGLVIVVTLARLVRADDTPPTDLVPSQALGFVNIRVAELWKSDALREVRGLVEKAGDDAVKALDARFLPKPSSIDRLTAILLMDNQGGGGPPIVVAVSTRDAFDSEKLIASGLPGAMMEKVGDFKLYADPKSSIALHIVNNKLLIFGTIETVRAYLGAKMTPGPAVNPFAEALQDTGRKHIVAAINSSLLPGEAVGELPPPLQPLARAKMARVALNLGNELEFDLRLTYADDAAAKAGEDSAKSGVEMARKALADFRKEVEAKLMPKDGPAISPIAELPEAAFAVLALGGLKQADEYLGKLPMKRQGSSLALSVTLPAGPYTSMLSLSGFSAAMLLPAVQKVRVAASRSQVQNNMKQIGLAMHNYADTYGGRFPSAAICDKNGKPLLSWRVAILPYIEQDALYRQFRLDEPWDSDHNKKLMAVMPRVYSIPGITQPNETNTHFRVFVGNGALFDLRKGPRFAEITDGTSNTILVVEAGEAVPWTKPDEIEFMPDKDLPKLGKQMPNGFHVLMADGSVRFINAKIAPQTLKAAITRAGGEVLGPDF